MKKTLAIILLSTTTLTGCQTTSMEKINAGMGKIGTGLKDVLSEVAGSKSTADKQKTPSKNIFVSDLDKGMDAYDKGDYKTALQYFKPLAEKGDAVAQYHLGAMYESGQGVPKGYKQAFAWFTKSAKQGNAEAQNRLGDMYIRGLGVLKNYKLAYMWHSISASNGNERAIENVNFLEKELSPSEIEESQAMSSLCLESDYQNCEYKQKTPPKNIFVADFKKGRDAYDQGDFKTALQHWKPLAEKGNAVAQFTLGYMYHKGHGVPKDYNQAGFWHTKFVQMYVKGQSTPQDYKQAVDWFTKFAKQGDAAAQYWLGEMYDHGLGVPQDDKQAVDWYTKSAKQGNANAQSALGDVYAYGLGVPKDYKKAFDWYTKSAKQGVAGAQSWLGQMYFKGIGVLKNHKLAYMWLSISASNGNEEAIEDVDFLEEKLSPSEIEEAQAMSSLCVESNYQNCEYKQKDPPHKKTPSTKDRDGTNKVYSSGSGYLISKNGLILTNEHVVQQCQTITVGQNKGKISNAVIVRKDVINDLALLQADNINKNINEIPNIKNGLVRKNKVALGEKILVAGFPYGDMLSDTLKVNSGLVSSVVGLGNNISQFQIDAAVQSGNSGGPVYDEYGNIIGTVVSQLNKLKVAKATGSLPENINYAINSDTIARFLEFAGYKTSYSKKSKKLSSKELSEIAMKQTYMIRCEGK